MSGTHLWEELAAWAISVAVWCVSVVGSLYAVVTEWREWRRRRAAGRPPRGEGTGNAGARR